MTLPPEIEAILDRGDQELTPLPPELEELGLADEFGLCIDDKELNRPMPDAEYDGIYSDI